MSSGRDAGRGSEHRKEGSTSVAYRPVLSALVASVTFGVITAIVIPSPAPEMVLRTMLFGLAFYGVGRWTSRRGS